MQLRNIVVVAQVVKSTLFRFCKFAMFQKQQKIFNSSRLSIENETALETIKHVVAETDIDALKIKKIIKNK